MKAEYVDHMGSDITVVNAARVSFDKEVDSIREDDKRLISYLARHNHFTPFTHPMITLRETVPIFVARQRFKHVVGFTYNEVSRRYVSSTPDVYVPDVWRASAANKKQGSHATDTVSDVYLFDGITDADGVALSPAMGYSTNIHELYADTVNAALETYEAMIRSGVCPEQARMVLPQSMYTSYYVTGSLAAFARMYKLRMDWHAQKEIQELAEKIGNVIQPLFPLSWEALTDD